MSATGFIEPTTPVYVITDADAYIIANHTSPVTTNIILPTNPAIGRYVYIKNASQGTTAFNLLIIPNAADKIDDKPNWVLGNLGSLQVVYIGGVWSVM